MRLLNINSIPWEEIKHNKEYRCHYTKINTETKPTVSLELRVLDVEIVKNGSVFFDGYDRINLFYKQKDENFGYFTMAKGSYGDRYILRYNL